MTTNTIQTKLINFLSYFIKHIKSIFFFFFFLLAAASTCTYETSQSHYQPPSWTPHLQPTANPTIEPIWSSFPEPNVAVYPHNPTTIYHHQQESPSSVIPTMPTTQSSPNSHNVTYPDCLSL